MIDTADDKTLELPLVSTEGNNRFPIAMIHQHNPVTDTASTIDIYRRDQLDKALSMLKTHPDKDSMRVFVRHW